MGSLEEVEEELRSLVAKAQSLDLWPPWDAAKTMVDLVARVVEIAGEPPRPDPAELETVKTAWHAVGAAVSSASNDISTVQSALAAPDVWAGEAGGICRTSLTNLSTRMDTVPTACDAVGRALLHCADDMRAARSRHAEGYRQIRRQLSISWPDALPWQLVDRLKEILQDIVRGIEDLIGSYSDAAATIRRCRRSVLAALDEVNLPDHLAAGTSAVTVVNGWAPGGDDAGPLRGTTLERADRRMASMPPEQGAAVQKLLDEAGDDQSKAWILAAVASGVAVPTITRFAGKLATMTPQQREALDPTRTLGSDRARDSKDRTFTQPDQTTCGSSSLVMSRMLNDPAYAMYVMTGYDPRTGETAPGDVGAAHERFQDESLKMHRQTSGWTDHDGDRQQPWPAAVGTSPWGAAHQMGGGDGRSGLPLSSYGDDVVDPHNAGKTYDHIVGATQNGHTVPLFIGDGRIPRHIVLVTSSSNDTLTIYDPAAGETHTVSRDDFSNGRLGIAGWDQAWAAVTPR